MNDERKASATTDAAWVAWWKPPSPNAAWRAVCQADSFDRASDLIGHFMEGGNIMILPGGREPWQVVQED